MTVDQIRRRALLADRHDRALRVWPDRRGEAFEQELTAVVNGLVALTNEVDQANAPAEYGRTLRYLGDAYFDLGQGTKRAILALGAAAYERAENFVDPQREPEERAKLDFNHANTLRGLSGGTDVSLLEQARDHYVRAVSLFQTRLPQNVDIADQARRSVETQLALARSVGNASVSTKDDDRQSMAAILAMIRLRFENEALTGRIAPSRRRALESVLGRLETLLANDPADISAHVRWLGQLRELRSQTSLLERASYAKPIPEGTRGALVIGFLETLKAVVARDTARPALPRFEAEAGRELFKRLAEASATLVEAGSDDSSTKGLERDLLRHVSVDTRRYVRRSHVTLAKPFWGAASSAAEANGVFFSGTPAVRQIVDAVCRTRGATLRGQTTGREIGRARWNDLTKSAVAIFDFTAQPGLALAAVCYEMGLASTLGVTPIVLARHDQRLPFDVGVYPYELVGADDETVVANALDDALYGAPDAVSGNSVQATVRHAQTVFTGAGVEGSHILRLLTASDDAIESRQLLEQLVGFAGSDAWLVSLPAWPGAYPQPDQRRCFHVMPFRQPWSDSAMAHVSNACRTAGAAYIRGDRAVTPDVMVSIWKEIATASHIVVDLTDANPNVALELGIAHGLGRPVLPVGQARTVEMLLWPSIAKLRAYSYTLDSGCNELTTISETFLEAERV